VVQIGHSVYYYIKSPSPLTSWKENDRIYRQLRRRCMLYISMKATLGGGKGFSRGVGGA
jgi:hypothetical protein